MPSLDASEVSNTPGRKQPTSPLPCRQLWGVYAAWTEPTNYQLRDSVAGSQSSAWSHTGLEEPVMGTGSNFVGSVRKRPRYSPYSGL